MKIESIVGRRTFLKCAATLGGIAALFGVVRPAAGKPEEPLQQPDAPGQGYRLTEHIKKYYETARL
jgi:hypothetical protein